MKFHSAHIVNINIYYFISFKDFYYAAQKEFILSLGDYLCSDYAFFPMFDKWLYT